MLKNFITLTVLRGEPETMTFNINYIVRIADAQASTHKSAIETSLGKLYWILEDSTEIKKRIIEAQK